MRPIGLSAEDVYAPRVMRRDVDMMMRCLNTDAEVKNGKNGR
jgi:hypothetical protein